jgi:hypothetical protein
MLLEAVMEEEEELAVPVRESAAALADWVPVELRRK